jgi:hypothetical protein
MAKFAFEFVIVSGVKLAETLLLSSYALLPLAAALNIDQKFNCPTICNKVQGKHNYRRAIVGTLVRARLLGIPTFEA